jgi:L,D-transpeptidase-like protein
MRVCALAFSLVCVASAAAAQQVTYHLEPRSRGLQNLEERFSERQIGLLEKLNRADRRSLPGLRQIVVPDRWLDDELGYSPLPANDPATLPYPKFLVLIQSHQVFGAYEFGRLVRWGPVSSGRESAPTPAGQFHLNWRSTGRHSTVDADWYMPWYFNFENELGLSLHQYALPGLPASHACVRLLEQDARWLFTWGDEWTLDMKQRAVLRPGTPFLVVGQYDFSRPPPWRTLDAATMEVALPE